MLTVKQALAKLNSAVGKLESSAHSVETALAGKQRDMFVAPAAAATPPKNGNGSTPDNAIITQRLDSAIKKVEELLGG